MKKDFWAIWNGNGIKIDSSNRPLIFLRLLDAKVWMIKNPSARAEIIKCHIKDHT